MEPDEGRYALNPQAMKRHGDYVTPHLKGVVYLEKPPLAYWATALAFKDLERGKDRSSLPGHYVPGVASCLVYAMGVHFRDRKDGLYGAAVLTTMALPFALGGSTSSTCHCWLFSSNPVRVVRVPRFREARRIQKAMLYLMYAAASLAFLTKGLVGGVFPFAVLVLWLLWRRRPGDVLRIFSPVGIMLFLLLTGPWLYFVQKANPGFLHFFFVQEHFLRYTTTLHERTEPFYYYMPVLAGGTLPWWPYLFQVVRGNRSGAIRLTPKHRFDRDEWSLCLIWAATVFLFFTLSSSKLASNMAPLVPPLAHLRGCLFRQGPRHDDPVGIWRRLPGVLQALAWALVLRPLPFPYIRIVNPMARLVFPGAVQLAFSSSRVARGK
jgi:4-amino-4-deoxy-L-arabinose transferase-like glycosyltransferase